LGSIGRRHIRNIKSIDPEAQIVVWRRAIGAAIPEDAALSIDKTVTSLEEALATKPDVAFITNPASMHVETGLKLASHDISMMIEKPLSNSMTGVDALLELCEQRRLVLMVGYNLRFYPPLKMMKQEIDAGRIGQIMTIRAKVGQYLPDWRPETDYREGVSARAELGGGVVLELSHELDYVRWLAGEVESVSAQLGRVSDLEIDVEDTADINLRFSNGAMGSVHMNMVQKPAARGCRVVGTAGTLLWDWSCHRVSLFDNDSEAWSDLPVWGDDGPPSDNNDTYIAEAKHFFDCVAGRREAIVCGKHAKKVLEIALAAKRSSDERTEVTV